MAMDSGTTSNDATSDAPMEVSVALSCGVALATTTVLYVVLAKMLSEESFLRRIMFGDAPEFRIVSCFGFFVGVGMLVLKMLKLRSEYAILRQQLLPPHAKPYIDTDTAERLLRELSGNAAAPQRSVLLTRLKSGLRQFVISGSSSDVNALLQGKSDIDFSHMQGSYQIIKFVIWFLPVLGFLGTVYGIGGALANFSGLVAGASDFAKLKAQLGEVMKPLGTAFDAPLVALSLSSLLMFQTTYVQKGEEEWLARIDDYCLENLLNKLIHKDGGSSPDPVAGPAGLQRDIREYLSRQMDQIQTLVRAIQDLGPAARPAAPPSAPDRAPMRPATEEGMRQLIEESQRVAQAIRDMHIALVDALRDRA